MEHISILLELKNELHKMNENIIKLLERDKVQNKRIDKHGEDLESLRNKVDSNKEFVNKGIGAMAIIGLAMPIFTAIILKFIK